MTNFSGNRALSTTSEPGRYVKSPVTGKCTECYWGRSRIYDERGETQLAETLLNQAVLKHAYADYPKKRLA